MPSDISTSACNGSWNCNYCTAIHLSNASNKLNVSCEELVSCRVFSISQSSGLCQLRAFSWYCKAPGPPYIPCNPFGANNRLAQYRTQHISSTCSQQERHGHNLFYVKNSVTVQGWLRGTLSEKYRVDLVGALVLYYFKPGRR